MAQRRPSHHRTAVAVLAAAAVLVAACGQSPQSAGRGEQMLVGRQERLPASSMSQGQVMAADDAFSLALFGQVCPHMPWSNLMLSPESAAEGLGMLYAGAKGPTAAAIGRLLHLPPWKPGLVAALARHTAALAGLRQLVVSNHLFEQFGERPAQQVLDDLRTAYQSELRLVDFGDEPMTTNQINAVVGQDTHGLIPALFQAPLPQSTRTVLTNALYLKASWLHPFPAASPEPFHTAAGGGVGVPMMTSTVPVASYRSADGWQSATLAYAGGQLAAVALLPPAHSASCAAPTLARWQALTSGPSGQPAEVQLPALHLSQTWDNLQASLAAMGLPLSGDYTGLGAADSQISEIVQQDIMNVTSAGTSAAAATGIAIGTAEPAGQAVSLNFNRPFLLVLEDTATDTPLFLAHITDPAQR
jgi:serpin B